MSATRSTFGTGQFASESFGRRVVSFLANPNASVFILLLVLIAALPSDLADHAGQVNGSFNT